MTEFIVSAEARLRESVMREAYCQGRSEALAQHLINRDEIIAGMKRDWEQSEVSLNARIAELEDQLRVARHTDELTELQQTEAADAE